MPEQSATDEPTPAEEPSLFSGNVSIANGLNSLRLRLLDLTGRNRLVNFKHTAGRSLQFIHSNLDATFKRITADTTKKVSILPLADPDRSEWEKQNGRLVRPEPKDYALKRGINPSYDLGREAQNGSSPPASGAQIRTLFYAEDLGKHCRKLEREAKLALEETGANMLYLVMGFLEFPEQPDGEKKYLAPLICVPVNITRTEEGKYSAFHLNYSGEELTDNLSLREKVKRDFGLNLPAFDSENEESIEAYLKRVEKVLRDLPEWRVRKMISLALLSFTNMLLVRDLDPANWPLLKKKSLLLEHPLVRQVFEGRPAGGDAQYAQEFAVDEHPKRDIPLIYDADSSQHSALIDVLEGRSRVIEGPPGTGKSQTITNLIAAALHSGKKVLFVAEKLAALEVVKSRLTLAGLDPFVLELHSNKTNKKRVLEDLDARIKVRLRSLGDLPSLIEQQERKRKALKTYSDLVNSKVGEHEELTLYQVMWRAELNRMRCGAGANEVQHLDYPAAMRTSSSGLAELCDHLRYLAESFQAIGTFGKDHPLWGFFPAEFKPEDDVPVQRLLEEYAGKFESFARAASDAAQLLEVAEIGVPSQTSANFLGILESLTPPTAGEIEFTLLPALFSANDDQGADSLKILNDIQITQDELLSMEARISRDLKIANPVSKGFVENAKALLSQIQTHGLAMMDADGLQENLLFLQQDIEAAKEAFHSLTEIAKTCGLQFDGMVADVSKLEALAKPLGEAPIQLLHLRHDALALPGTVQRLRGAQSQLRKLAVAQALFVEEFYLDMAPSDAELKVCILTLREGSTWYRIFQKRWRAAIQSHRQLERTKSKKSAAERLTELEALVNHRRQQEAWLTDPALTTAAGPYFLGEQTPLGDLEKVAVWLEQSTVALDAAQVPRQVFDPAGSDRSTVARLVAEIPKIQGALASLITLDARMQLFLKNAQARLRKSFCSNSWRNRFAAADNLVEFLERTTRFIGPQLKPGVSLADGLTSILTGYELAQKIKALNSYQLGRNLLGRHFEGRGTKVDRIMSTHAYGNLIARSKLPLSFRQILLSPNCAINHARLNEYLQCIGRGWQDAVDFEIVMNRFGAFESMTWVNSRELLTSEYAVALAKRTRYAAESVGGLMLWAQYVRARQEVSRAGLEPFALKMEGGLVLPDKLKEAFVYRFYASVAQQVFNSSTALRQFSGRRHTLVREEYAELDRQIIQLRGLQVAHECRKGSSPPVGVNAALVAEKTEMTLLEYLIPQQRPRVTVRAMLKRAGKAIQELKPCFMMGPQAVAQFLEPGQLDFDILVMDEASQLRPEEAIGAIARAKQVVVVGDPKQLPPTSFFSRSNQTDTDDDGVGQMATSEAESILDVCISHFQPVRTLRWHYRSRHESLIAFSNQRFYRGQLVVFPSPYPKSKLLGLRYTYVSNGVYESQMNQVEARRVVDATVEHILNRPQDSLGIVTLNVKQRDLVAEMLDERLRNLVEFDAFNKTWEKEGMGLFVKNLENVQGDERDCIIISTTFGRPSGVGVVRQNFGPISRQGGWRRLNVLFTRARKSVSVFSSMRPEDIVDDTRTPEGTRALRAYLEFARSGMLPIEQETGLPPDSDFEVAVMDVLKLKGYETTPQLGVAGFRIDIGVKHPEHRSGYLAAIECDGASYHSGVSVRDRDRIRQEILEGLGWKGRIWRIWSTDWFRNPLAETERLLQFLNALKEKPVPEEFLFSEKADVDDAESPKDNNDSDTVDSGGTRELVFDDDEGDLEVEIGDLVDYSPVESPDNELTVRLTARQTDLNAGLVAEGTPLGSILVGATVGETVVLRVPGKQPQAFVIRSIRRMAEEDAS